MKPREMIKYLEGLGFWFERNGKGDHKIFTNGVIRLPIPCCGTIENRLAKYIKLQATGETSHQKLRREKFKCPK